MQFSSLFELPCRSQQNLAPLWHPVYDDGKGGGWKWWGCHFVILNSHISAHATCFARKFCSLVRSTWGISLGEDKLGARVGYFLQRYRVGHVPGARRANIPPKAHVIECCTPTYSPQNDCHDMLIIMVYIMGRFIFKITSQRLLDQSQAGVYMGKTPHTPPFWPFWA